MEMLFLILLGLLMYKNATDLGDIMGHDDFYIPQTCWSNLLVLTVCLCVCIFASTLKIMTYVNRDKLIISY